MEINKSELMKQAWVAARNFAFMNGGTAKEWFAYALAQRWAFEKKIRAPKEAAPTRVTAETKVRKIKDWFVGKNFDLQDLSIYNDRKEINTIEETAKAVRVQIVSFASGSFTTWVPKSCIAA